MQKIMGSVKWWSDMQQNRPAAFDHQDAYYMVYFQVNTQASLHCEALHHS